jgi:hypothetical protein
LSFVTEPELLLRKCRISQPSNRTLTTKKNIILYILPEMTVMCHLPNSTPVEDIYDRLMSLDFDVINVKQMTTNRRSSSEGTTTVNLPLFLIT